MELYRESTDLSLLQLLGLFFGFFWRYASSSIAGCIVRVPARGLTAFTFIGVRGG